MRVSILFIICLLLYAVTEWARIVPGASQGWLDFAQLIGLFFGLWVFWLMLNLSNKSVIERRAEEARLKEEAKAEKDKANEEQAARGDRNSSQAPSTPNK